ncbi:MAG TPA: winged helix-turn-helix transcriptional regulator [Solirubrobacterales bacterium]|nr:winged helix-turn-helix transcriptional regulator [Solirubrobacterales bacterium]
MPSTSNVLDEALDLVKKRLAELDEERKRLERALAELGGTVTRRPGRPPGSGRGPGRPRKNAATAAAKPAAAPRKRRRRRRGGTRADQAVALVEQNPGISASEIAKQMKIKPNYLYRVLGEMEKEGRVIKKGREYHPGK